jgi:pimeloyl-ACP methyl ester carboxylesterase
MTASFSIPLFEQELLQFITVHQFQAVNIFGYSMGGYVALQCALHHPDAIGRIMTLGTKMKWDPDTTAKEVKMLNPAAVEQKIPAFGETLKERHAPVDWKSNMLATASMMTVLGSGGALTGTDLQQIQHDVHLHIGEQDTMVTIAETQWAASQLPNGRCSTMPGWKHPLEAIDVDTLAAAIRANFLSA